MSFWNTSGFFVSVFVFCKRTLYAYQSLSYSPSWYCIRLQTSAGAVSLLEMHWAHLNKETIWLFIGIIVDLTGNFNDDCGHNVTVMAQPLQEELCAVLDAQPLCWIKWRLWVTVIGHLPCNSILELFLKTTKTGKCQRHCIRKGQATLLHSLITFIPFINSANKGILKRFLKLSVAYIFKRIVIYSLGKMNYYFCLKLIFSSILD